MSEFRPAAGVLLFYGELVLLCKRCLEYEGNPVPYGGYWSPFTGSLEKGESPLVAAARELHEESGLKVCSWDLKYIKEIQRPDNSLVLYAHELKKHFVPSLDAEHSEYGYFKIRDLKMHPKPLDIEIKQAIDFYNTVLRHHKFSKGNRPEV